jgi:uncharacterized integral membrane protein
MNRANDQTNECLLAENVHFQNVDGYVANTSHSQPLNRSGLPYQRWKSRIERSRDGLIRSVSSWICLLLALLFLILTTLYAARIPLSSRFNFVYNSSSNTIFVLSLLSGITGILLTAVVGFTFENLQWLVLVRRRGSRTTEFLSLNPATSISGLLSLIFANGESISSTARPWSILRLLGAALPPVLGVVIMSAYFYRIKKPSFSNNQR